MNDLANSTMTTNPPKRIDFNTPELQRKRRIRALKDLSLIHISEPTRPY